MNDTCFYADGTDFFLCMHYIYYIYMCIVCCLQNGVVSLIDCTLVEDPEGTDDECECLNIFL